MYQYPLQNLDIHNIKEVIFKTDLGWSIEVSFKYEWLKRVRY